MSIDSFIHSEIKARCLMYLASPLPKPSVTAKPAVIAKSNISNLTPEARFALLKERLTIKATLDSLTEELALTNCEAIPSPTIAAIPRPGITQQLSSLPKVSPPSLQAPAAVSSRSMANKSITKDQAMEVAKWRLARSPRPGIKKSIEFVLSMYANNADSKLVQNCTHTLLNPDYKAPSQKPAPSTYAALDLEE